MRYSFDFLTHLKHRDDGMTVKELIEKLSLLNPDATVYTMAHDDNIALIVTDVQENILTGKDETVVLVY